jgi:hypothetical protein
MQPRNGRSVLFYSWLRFLSLKGGFRIGILSIVSPAYFCNLDTNLMRLDRLQRPELNKGTVDFIVPEDYWASPPPLSLTRSYSSIEPSSSVPRKPQSMNYLFAFDVSLEAIHSGFLQTACNSLREMLYGRADDGIEPCFPAESHVAIVTFDKSLYFYNLSVSRGMDVLANVKLTFIVVTFKNCTDDGATGY